MVAAGAAVNHRICFESSAPLGHISEAALPLTLAALSRLSSMLTRNFKMIAQVLLSTADKSM
jgi:hypothetical protein